MIQLSSKFLCLGDLALTGLTLENRPVKTEKNNSSSSPDRKYVQADLWCDWLHDISGTYRHTHWLFKSQCS